MKKISLIIPIYNTEEYLEKCLNSAVSQTYPNMEFICVDDGSTDNSGRIVDEFAKKDDRILVIHQKNYGESHARNVGLLASTGEYIGFLDCDDWIEPEMYSELAKVMEKNKADLAAASWIKEFDGHHEIIHNEKSVKSELFRRNALLYYVYKRDTYQGLAYMWNKLYKRENLCDKNGKILLFDETLQLGGDILYLARACLKVKNAIYIDKGFYHYRQRETSGCHTSDLNKWMDALRAYQNVIELFEKEKIDVEIIGFIKRFLAYHSSNVAEMAYQQKSKKMFGNCIRIMRQYQKEYEKYNVEHPEWIERYRSILEYTIIEKKEN